MSNPLRLGILGCGRIVQRRMLPALQGLEAVTVAAIASERDGIAKEIAGQFGIPKTYQNYEDLLKDPEIDAVYIPCSGDLHERWTVAASAHGKHVLCEKPLASSLEEAENMVDACETDGVILMEAFMWRHHPRAQRVKELIEEGTIGNLRLMNISFSFDIDRNDWRLDPHRGGGAMGDLGCYGVNCSRFMTDLEPTEINASARWGETGVDMTMRIGLTFPDDILANIDCSFELPFRCRAEFVGDGGRILLNHAFQPHEDSTIHLWKSTNNEEPEEILTCEDVNQYAAQVQHFCKSIEAGKLLPPAENGLQNMRIMYEVLESARM